MANYIEREALLKEIQEEVDYELSTHTDNETKWICGGLRVAMRDIRNQPTVDVVPRDEVAKIFEEIERNIFKLETPYQTLHCIPSGLIEELKKEYTPN